MPAALGLTTYRWNNNIKSILLLLAFPVLLLTLLGGIFFVYGLVNIFPQDQFGAFQSLGITSVLGSGGPGDLAFSAVVAWWPIVLGVASVWVLVGYYFNGTIIHFATGAKPVTRDQAPKLYNLLENLCISRGITMPPLYVIDTDVMNAYSSGIDDRSYAITVTRGLLDQLNSDELEAVLAHELTHIVDRDCRLLIVTIVFAGMLSFLAQMLWRGLRVSSFSRARGKGGGAIVLIMAIAAVAMLVGYVMALILRLSLSRRREYLADAGSVELTKNPDALISALLKIAKNPDVPHVPSEVRQMFIENSPSGFDVGGLFATHPPIGERIHVLEELGGHPPDAPDPKSALSTTAAALPGFPPGTKSPWQ